MIGASPAGGRRRPLAAGLVAATGLLFVWLAAGVHRVPAGGAGFELRRWITGGSSLLAPGLRVTPPGLARVIRFPAAPRPARVRVAPAAGDAALRSSEGVALIAAGTLTVTPDPARAAALGRLFPRGWDASAGDRIGSALGPPLARRTAGRSFTDLLQSSRPGGAPDAGLAADLGALGLRLEGGLLRFYPAPAPPVPPVAPFSGAEPDGLTRPSGPSRRVLLVGLDGADWDIIDPLMRQGRMPHMKRLVDGGVRARLRTISPVLSPIIWTTIVTGVGPDRHGIVDFLATSATTGNQIPVTSNMRRVKALWNILSDAGLTAGVIAWWATWPAEPVNGVIVSDRIAYQLFGYPEGGPSLRRRTYPEALGLVIQPMVVAPSQIGDDEVRRFLPRGPAPGGEGEEMTRKLRTILASTRTYLGIGLDLLGAYDPDLKAIYFEGPDTIAHNFMRYRPPAMSGVTSAELEHYGEVVDRFYEYQDEALGRALELADERTVVIVCSDHGFRTGSNRPPTDPRIEKGGAADWHRKFGIFVMTGPGVRRGAALDDLSVMDVTPTVLAAMGLPVAEDMTGRAAAAAFDPPAARRTIATYEKGRGGGDHPVADPVASELDDEIVARLEALGYVAADEGANAMNNTGVTMLDRGRYAEAADIFRRAVRREPRFLHARINLGRALVLMKQPDEALKVFEETLRLDPRQAEAHNLMGNVAMDRRDFARAERHYRASLAIAPNDTHTRNSLGLLYEKQNRDDEAIREFEAVIAADADYAEAFNNIGLIHRKRGEPRRAIEMFERAIRADAGFAGSYNNMGLAWQDLGRLDEARRAFDRGLQVDPDNAVILNNLGTIDLAEQSLQAARARFEQAIRADPDYPSAYNNLGAVLGMTGDEDGALAQYTKAIELDPGYTDARFNLARHHVMQGDTGQGIALLRDLLERDPEYAKGQLQLGLLLMKTGDVEEALRWVGEAARRMPRSPDPQNVLAEIYLSRGRREEARQALLRSLAIDGGQTKVREALQRLESGGAGSAPPTSAP